MPDSSLVFSSKYSRELTNTSKKSRKSRKSRKNKKKKKNVNDDVSDNENKYYKNDVSEYYRVYIEVKSDRDGT